MKGNNKTRKKMRNEKRETENERNQRKWKLM